MHLLKGEVFVSLSPYSIIYLKVYSFTPTDSHAWKFTGEGSSKLTKYFIDCAKPSFFIVIIFEMYSGVVKIQESSVCFKMKSTEDMPIESKNPIVVIE